MNKADLSGKRVAIIAGDYFEQSELIGPRDELIGTGVEVDVLAPHLGTIQGLKHIELGDKVQVAELIAEADPDDYDAAVVPGGVVNSDNLRIDADAQYFIKQIVESGKPTAAICHGPWLLVSAGLVDGRTLTSYHTIRDDIKNAGGHWLDEEVVIDGNIITSRSPDDLPAFSRELAEMLASKPVRAVF